MRCTLQASGVDLKWHMVKPITVVSDSNRLRAAVLKALLWTSGRTWELARNAHSQPHRTF